ncbi:MAG: pilus assembly protein PilM [Kiritimatiellia bacterium]|nr:pilus assembly protein PilM [Kiritimatiellia bacterium]MDP6630368.1 pilus assembly protein PilM [Kiritimatiellia bacterium]MDP6810874.1 pilus assembly protein PilM [Kiritimatiellia bacterium]MDP7024217.1 pilus assembly protein PilM [Kiritimatiellia bacterium]
MAKGRATGFVLDGDRLEWAALVHAGDRLRRVDQGMEVLASAEEGTDAGAALEAQAEQVRKACASVKGDTVLGLPSTEVLLRVVDLPAVGDDELSEMVELQADKFSPFPIETMAVSHEVLERGDAQCRVLVAAARDEAIGAHAQLLVEAGLRPAGIDSCALGWWRLLQDAGGVPGEGRALLVIVAGPVVDLVAVQDGLPLLFRSLDLGVDLPTADVAAEIGQELNHTLISLELEQGSQPCSVALWAYEDQLAALGSALQAQDVDQLTTHALDGLPTVCEGIARRMISGGGIDLTPRAWLDADEAARHRRQVLGGLAGVLGVWLLCVVVLVSLLGWRKGAVKRLQARRQTWEQPAMDVRELRSRVLMIDRYTDMSRSALECLLEISGIQPKGVDLVSYTYTKGDTIRIKGQASARSMIYGFKEALDTSGFFPSVELGTQIQDPRRRHWNFDMVLNLPGGEETL